MLPCDVCDRGVLTLSSTIAPVGFLDGATSGVSEMTRGP